MSSVKRKYRKRKGLVDQSSLAKMIGVTQASIWNWISWGQIPAPTVQINENGRKYYTAKQAARIAAQMK